MLVVDSSVWIDYFNGVKNRQTNLLDDLLGKEPVCAGDIITLEVLQGFRNDLDFQRAKKLLNTLILKEMLDFELAYKSAAHYRFLKKKGITVRKTIDMIIGTFCIENGYALLHSDKDFLSMEKHLGLKCV